MAEIPGINDDRGQTIQGVSSAAVSQKIPTNIAVNPSTNAMLVEISGGATDQDVNLISVSGSTITLGQKAMASSLPVVLASDQAAIPVTLTSTTITGTVAATQSGNWTSRIVGNAGATLDSTVGVGTAPTNQVVVGALYNSTEISPSTGQAFALQGDSKGRLRNVIMDAAGNTRGANVTAANAILVDLSATTANATPVGIKPQGGASTLADGVGNQITSWQAINGNDLYTPVMPFLFNNTTWDRQRSIINATNSTGTGIQAVGLTAQLDDTSPTAITENQFGNLRMSANRNQYVTIRDAAGNERGLNIDANNAIAVTATNATASNLKVAATLDAETTKVIGTVRNLGNVGAIFDGVNTAATAPANGILGLGIYNSSEPSPSTGQSVGIQLDSKGRQKITIMDAAGNNRGLNINSDGSLSSKITDGTNTANILKNDGTAAGQNGELIGGAYQSVSFTTTTVQAVGTTDAGNYRWVSVHITGQGSNSLTTFQGSNDNTNWSNAALELASNTANPAETVTGGTGIWHGPLGYRYFRISVSGISAGTTAGVIQFHTLPAVLASSGVVAVQQGTWNVGNGPASTALNTYSIHLSSNTTTTPTSSTAYISTITISSEVGGTTSTLSIQDKQGTPLKLINGFTTTAVTTTPTVINFQSPIKMTSGIDIITAGVAAATLDIWIDYFQ